MVKLIQLLGDGIEELWEFPSDMTNEEISEIYKQFQQHPDFEDFEEYIEEYNPQIEATRQFVEEIYV